MSENTLDCKMETLPIEILEKIFSYLPLADRKDCRLVCKLWNEISYTKSLTKLDVVSAPNFNALATLNRPYRNLRISNCKVNEDSEYFKKWGKGIEHLDITVICTLAGFSDLILSHTCNLTSLKLDLRILSGVEKDVDDNSTFDLPNLKHFSIGLNSSTYWFKTFFSFLTNSRRLESVDIAMCYWHIDADIMIPFFRQFATSLLSFTLSGRFDYDDVYGVILKHVHRQLKAIHLDESYEKYNARIRKETIDGIVGKFPDLEEISLTEMDEQFVYSLISHLKKLRSIRISSSPLIENSWAVKISSLTNLSSLAINAVKSSVDSTFSWGFGEHDGLPNLTFLELTVPDLDDSSVALILPKAPNLTALSITVAFQGVSNVTVLNLTKFCLKLYSLKLFYCGITDVSAINSLKKLYELELKENANLSNDGVANLKLPYLQRLVLTGTWVNEDGCKVLVENCPSLRLLEIGCGESYPTRHDNCF